MLHSECSAAMKGDYTDRKDPDRRGERWQSGRVLQHLLNRPNQLFVFNSGSDGIIHPLLHHEDVSILWPPYHTHKHTHPETSEAQPVCLRYQSPRSSCSLQPIWRCRGPRHPDPGTRLSLLSSSRTRGGGRGEGFGSRELLQTETWRALSDLRGLHREIWGTADSTSEWL